MDGQLKKAITGLTTQVQDHLLKRTGASNQLLLDWNPQNPTTTTATTSWATGTGQEAREGLCNGLCSPRLKLLGRRIRQMMPLSPVTLAQIQQFMESKVSALHGQLIEFKETLLVPQAQPEQSVPPESKISGMTSSVEELQSALGPRPSAPPRAPLPATPIMDPAFSVAAKVPFPPPGHHRASAAPLRPAPAGLFDTLLERYRTEASHFRDLTEKQEKEIARLSAASTGLPAPEDGDYTSGAPLARCKRARLGAKTSHNTRR